MTPITSAIRRQMTDEGARVTADRDEFCAVCDAVDSIHARKLKALDASTVRVDELCRENERLRELVKRAQTVIEDNCALCDYFTGCTILQDGRCAAQTLFRQELRELGVDDG